MTTPSTAAELVAQLVGLGVSKRSIGRSIGVNDSYVGRIVTGARGTTGANYLGRLQQLRAEIDARAAAGVPLRKGEAVTTTAPVTKRAQKLRRPSRVYDSARASTARAGKQAARNGSRTLVGELQHAAAGGRRVVVQMTTVSHTVARKSTYGRHVEPKGRERRWTFEIGPVDADELLPYVEAAGGSLVEGAVLWSVDAGQFESELDEDQAATIVAVELRTWLQ